MALPLHRVGSAADWQLIDESEHNPWQKIAARSRGILTPANIISILGVILVASGILEITRPEPHIWNGLVLIGLGRLADIADGAVAEATGTKSPLGELLDATVDKILLAISLIAFTVTDLLPIGVSIVLLVNGLWNTALSLYAKTKGAALHASREGKLAVFISWLLLMFFPGSVLLQDEYQAISTVFAILALINFVIFCVLAFISSKNYLLDLKLTLGNLNEQ